MITPDEYREVMRNLAAGVTVVTTVVDDEFYGMTATSFTSVSLEPMLVQVTLDKSSRTHAALRSSRKFGINILGADEEALARKCSESLAMDRFEYTDLKVGDTGVPLIVGSIGMLECRLVDELEVGDHTVFVGEVVNGFADEGPPLIYFQGQYRRLHEEGGLS